MIPSRIFFRAHALAQNSFSVTRHLTFSAMRCSSKRIFCHAKRLFNVIVTRLISWHPRPTLIEPCPVMMATSVCGNIGLVCCTGSSTLQICQQLQIRQHQVWSLVASSRESATSALLRLAAHKSQRVVLMVMHRRRILCSSSTTNKRVFIS